MKEHNYALQTLQNDDTRPRLQSRTQNICFVISISAVILKLMVKITSSERCTLFVVFSFELSLSKRIQVKSSAVHSG